MGWTEEAPVSWILREASSDTLEQNKSEDWVWSTVLAERSVDLQQTDPGSRLRIAVAEAMDRHAIGERVDLLAFGDGVIEARELPIPARLGPALADTSAELVDHTHVDLRGALDSQAHWSDGPEFFVLICSAHIDVDRRLLYAAPVLDVAYADPHWPVSPPTDPHLTSKEPVVYDREGYPMDDLCDIQRPGGRYGACFAIASIGDEPSPKLRHLAELSGGVALPVRDAAEADAFAAACRTCFEAVVASVDARMSGADDHVSNASADVSPAASAPEVSTGGVCTDGSDAERLADDAATYLAVQDAIAEWADHEPQADEFIHVDVLVERSIAAGAADPAGSSRRAVADALHAHGVGRSRGLSTYGWGLISTYGICYDEDFRGPVREALRAPNDHARVDLGRACRQLQRLSGPEILIVLASSQIDPFDVSTTGSEHDDGTGIDYNTWEPVSDSQRYARDLEGRYPTVVLLGGLDGAVRPELRDWAESTGGIAMPARSSQEIDAFAQRCADIYRDWVEQIEAECTSGVLDLDRLYL